MRVGLFFLYFTAGSVITLSNRLGLSDIQMNLHIKNADVYTPSGIVRSDVFVSSGRVVSVGAECDLSRIDRVIDAAGLTLLPGLTDMHVHFREPGYSYKETIASGCAAAAAGGFTMVCTMPNVNPAPDTVEHLRAQTELIESAGSDVSVIPYATITASRMGVELPDYEALAPYVAGFSDDGTGVQSADVMREAMRRIAPTGRIVAAHCEVNSLLEGGYIHKGNYAARHGHKGICSESEWREIERDIELAAETGCRLHICHVSTAEGVELVRQAKKDGLDVTCETGPHYLWFSDEELQEDGRFKMNPPLRSPADRESLCEGLMDGTVDVIATDHAPHSVAEKSRGLAGSAMGVVGLETAFGAVYTRMCLQLGMPFSRLVECMSLRARDILRRGQFSVPGIAAEVPADFTFVNLESEYIVNPDDFRSMGRATPFAGMTLRGKPVEILNLKG